MLRTGPLREERVSATGWCAGGGRCQTDRMDIRLKRAYTPAAPDDGARVLVDRLWPRGLSKAEAQLDLWLKDVAPSPDLRKSWHSDREGHTPERFAAFAQSYRDELGRDPAHAALEELARIARTHPVLTLVYGAKDTAVNHAQVLRDSLRQRMADTAASS